jgi:hypothetical protein
LGLIVIDTAARVMPGGAEDTEDMGKFVAACDRIRATTEAAVLVVHHEGKDKNRGGRGSTVLPAAVDSEIAIDFDERTKISSVELVKSRDGETGPLFDFTLRIIELGHDADGDPITSGVVDPIENAAKETKPKSLTNTQKIALKALTDVLARGGAVPAPDSRIPPNVPCVSEAVWREYCGKRSISKGGPNAQRMAFNRAAEGLIDAGLVSKWGDLVWAITAPF